MTGAAEILVIILGIFLAVFLLLSIFLVVLLIQVTRQIARVSTTAEKVVGNAANVVAGFSKVTSPALLAKYVYKFVRDRKKS